MRSALAIGTAAERLRAAYLATGLRPAIVAPCGWVNGLAAIRLLGRAGIPVLALDHRADALGFSSRYCTPCLIADPLEDGRAYADTVSELVDAIGAGPLPIFATNDEVLEALGRNEEWIGDRLLRPFPAWGRLKLIQDKRFQVDEARRLGIPIPRTSLEPTDDFGYPVLVKPSDPPAFQRAFSGLHAFHCNSSAELRSAFLRSQEFRPLVQELVPGGDEQLYSFGAYFQRSGEPLGVFSGRKLRQTPPVVGTCRVGESVWVDEVIEHGIRYAAGLGFYGICQIEFKRDIRDGAFRLMEINPRLWQWHGLAAVCGVNLPVIAYRDLTGDVVEPVKMDKRSRRWAIALSGRSAPAVPRIPFVEAIFANDDLRPVARHLADLARRAASRIGLERA